MLVYHTSNQRFTDPDVIHSREALDFGKGFYVTRLKDQAEKYNIIGGVANDKVYQTVDLYMAGIYNKEQALQNLVYEMPNNQLCFVTQKSIDLCLAFIEHKTYNHG